MLPQGMKIRAKFTPRLFTHTSNIENGGGQVEYSKQGTGFKLMHRDSGNTMNFSQKITESQKITIPKVSVF